MTSDTPDPRVGVIVRTKNRPWFLRRTLEDVRRQTFAEWSVHIVNDGGSAARVDEVVAGMPPHVRDRVRVSHNDVSRGRSAAANQGIAGVKSEFVVLHDDDDLWAPDFLTDTVDWLDQHPDDIGVMVRTEIVYEVEEGTGFRETGRAPFWPGMTDITYSDLLQVNRAVPISYLYRRSLHDLVGPYREDLHAVEDWELSLRTTLHHHIGFLDGRPRAFWMQRVGATGEVGNSMFTLAADHDRYDRMIRDDALREYVTQYGAGLPLYLTAFVQSEVARQLDARRTLGQRATGAARAWWRGRRTR